MRCFRSILDTIQSLNSKERKETNGILKPAAKAELGHLLLRKRGTQPDHYKESCCRPDCYKELQCYAPLNCLSSKCKSNCEQRNRMNENECEKRSTNRFNLAKLQWIRNSLALDPFPDFKYNTVLIVNRGYKKLFKLVNLSRSSPSLTLFLRCCNNNRTLRRLSRRSRHQVLHICSLAW